MIIGRQFGKQKPTKWQQQLRQQSDEAEARRAPVPSGATRETRQRPQGPPTQAVAENNERIINWAVAGLGHKGQGSTGAGKK